MITPDYSGAGIANLMASVAEGLGAGEQPYPAASLLPSSVLGGAKNVLLFVIDGLGYNYLATRGRGSYLARRMLGRLTSVCPSTTASAIPTFLFGLPPQQHGFTGWFTYFRELGDVLAVLPFRPRHGGESLGRLGISPVDLCGCEPLFGRLRARVSVVMPEWIAGSDFNKAFHHAARILPYRGMREFFAKSALGVKQDGRNYVYAYWPEFDALAHEHGVASSAVFEHFEQLDEMLQALVRDISGTDTAIVVTSDHGFIDSPVEHTVMLADHPELADSLVLPLCGEPRLAYAYLRCGRERQFTDYIASELSHCVDLYPSRALLEQGWFGLGEPHPRLGERIGDYVLVMKGTHKIKDRILGDHPHSHLGVHGGVSAQEMYVPLIYIES